MTDRPKLQIEVQEDLRRIVVTLPHTSYEMRFGLIARGLCPLSGFGRNDPKAPITSHEFTIMPRLPQLRRRASWAGLWKAKHAKGSGNQ